jgi:mRNA interferase MazF
MGKPLVGDIVVLPFPNTDLTPGKRRPALVVADLPGVDLVLCQITSQAHTDRFAIAIGQRDFAKGQLAQNCFARANRLFTVDSNVILYVAATLSRAKTNDVLNAARALFPPLS